MSGLGKTVSFFSIIAFALALNGCGGAKEMVVAEKKELPSWYVSPPSSTSSDFYSLGEGRSKEEAIADALSMMASTFSVSVSSDFRAQTTVKNGSVNSAQSTYSNDVRSSVGKIRISNYDLLHSQRLGFKRYAALVKSNKIKLYSSLKKELEQKFYLIEKKKQTLSNLNAIQRANAYDSFSNELKDVPNVLIVMHSLNGDFDGTEDLQKAQEVDAERQNVVEKITFSVTSDASARNLKSSISKGLSAKKLKIKNARGKNHFVVHLKSTIQNSTSYGFYLARSAIDSTVKDYKGVVIGSNKLSLIGQSTSSFKDARENVAYKLTQMIKKEGISKVIGLEI